MNSDKFVNNITTNPLLQQDINQSNESFTGLWLELEDKKMIGKRTDFHYPKNLKSDT